MLYSRNLFQSKHHRRCLLDGALWLSRSQSQPRTHYRDYAFITAQQNVQPVGCTLDSLELLRYVIATLIEELLYHDVSLLSSYLAMVSFASSCFSPRCHFGGSNSVCFFLTRLSCDEL